MGYTSDPESIRQHPVPEWFHDAKLGIFIHWGLYSVPGWAPLTGELGEVAEREGWGAWFTRNPYAEWYMNTIRIPESPSYQYHVETYGPDFSYFDFVPLFQEAVTRWNPDHWAALFEQVGARYVVLTTKHHDGFLLWPSEHPNPFRSGYFSSRDLVGELTNAVRAHGMRMGLYYSSGLDWTFNDLVIRDLPDISAAIPRSSEYVAYVENHWRELIDRYEPSILWNDIAYPAEEGPYELFAYYYNKIPEGVVNDRFSPHFEFSGGLFATEIHFDFRTPEYATFPEIMSEKWEATRGIGYSFGYNRNEGPEHCISVEDLIRVFVDIVSKNGNLLLNVGPMADGTIPDIQRERLRGLGQWLAVNGEAIFGTRPWVVAEGRTSDGKDVRFTRKGDTLYAIVFDALPGQEVSIAGLSPREDAVIAWLGADQPAPWRREAGSLKVKLPERIPPATAYALRITPAPQGEEG